jgi:predicted Fe-Mo cluster-binding NifX family protein
MKVAIAKDGDEVSGHFGHCKQYAVFTVENGKITQRELLDSPGHEPGRLPAFLAQHGVTHVVAGGMGPRAVDLFCASSIEVYLGITGPIDTIIEDFIAGRVTPGESSCHHS